jgi:hypothetical protein
MEKRNHPRIALKNFSVDASDGVGFFQGVISDASRFGLCITDLPKRLNGQAQKMKIIISGPGRNFKMTVRPRWSTDDDGGKSVGAEILNPPWGWTEFIMKFEPQRSEDVWATVSL